jgi:hypothetical protein
MYIYAPNEAVEKYPYSIGQLRKDNPQTSFPRSPSKSLLAEYGVFPVTQVDLPQIDSMTQNLTEGTPVLTLGEWVQVWVVSDATPEEVEQRLAALLEEIRDQRGQAYAAEADPLFFQAQRGEATEQDWLDKIEEIRARYPYPESVDKV